MTHPLVIRKEEGGDLYLNTFIFFLKDVFLNILSNMYF